MKKIATLLPIGIGFLMLTGCAANVEEPHVSGDHDASDSIGQEPPPQGAGTTEPRWKAIHDCSQIETLVQSYIHELVPEEDNGKVEYIDDDGSTAWSVSCTWDMAEDETDIANGRTVEVSVEPVYELNPLDYVAMMDGYEAHENTALEDAGGRAYSLPMSIAIAGGSVTTVETPDTRVTVSAIALGETSHLDAEAAFAIALKLLNLEN